MDWTISKLMKPPCLAVSPSSVGICTAGEVNVQWSVVASARDGGVFGNCDIMFCAFRFSPQLPSVTAAAVGGAATSLVTNRH